MTGTLVKKFTDSYAAWHFLTDHPIFKFKDKYGDNHFRDCHRIEFIKVNPKTNLIDSDRSKNTRIMIRIECRLWYDMNLDCSASTFEKAIIKFANLVLEHYGDGR